MKIRLMKSKFDNNRRKIKESERISRTLSRKRKKTYRIMVSAGTFGVIVLGKSGVAANSLASKSRDLFVLLLHYLCESAGCRRQAFRRLREDSSNKANPSQQRFLLYFSSFCFFFFGFDNDFESGLILTV